MGSEMCIRDSLYGQIDRKAGVFARVAFDFDGLKFNDSIHPRVTVGYSTNLDAYINKVNKNKTTP